ncbi:hypothetical protein TsFJ059_000110 [Trichoderma semiorbis]|uniref:Heterokaryon incompatibility domain-containing protein n=1 Tax=Trichoderma semiorbis TaxID=1491008 RepID=A0A9P8HNU8_9HYPO|nr:hypothetical protein TsFJ059_000110 [Trichoderma semiorbis]
MAGPSKPKSWEKWLKRIFGTRLRASLDPSAAAAKAARPDTNVMVPNDHQLPATSQALPPACALPVESASNPPWTESTEQPMSVVDIMVGWLDSCNENHASCLSRPTTAPPARLIDVGDDDTDPCLRTTNETGDMGLYLALSYCWGEKIPPKTLTTNVADHSRGICLANLPRTFRDAVRIARAMRVRYLWIDSLCIIQDSPQDLAAETSRMDQIFQGAHVVLAAVDGGDSHFGLNIDDPVMSPEGAPTTTGFRPRVKKDGPCRSLDSIQQGVWRTRGWTLQEEMLARRILYFTHPSDESAGQVLWSCAHKIWFEDGTTKEVTKGPLPMERFPPTVVTVYEGTYGPRERTAYERVVDVLNLRQSKLHYQAWYALVEEYSRRRLSYPGDKLRAVRGLAMIHGQVGEAGSSDFEDGEQTAAADPAYLYGLWRGDMTWGLSWTSDGEWRKPAATEPPLRLPSWSWASVDGPVSWDVHDTERLYTVLSMGRAKARQYPDTPLQWYVMVEGLVIQRSKDKYLDDRFGKPNITHHLETDSAGVDEHLLLLVSTRDWELNVVSDIYSVFSGGTTLRMIMLKMLAGTDYEVVCNRIGWCEWEYSSVGASSNGDATSVLDLAERKTVRIF